MVAFFDWAGDKRAGAEAERVFKAFRGFDYITPFPFLKGKEAKEFRKIASKRVNFCGQARPQF